ncbi:MAG: hypothetical protein Q9M40_08540 [Sulfurimonas sp.]|nr:hypothetical protein [Sulfurimonas sp.]
MQTIAISVGDLNGVGIEIVLKSHEEVKKLCNPIYCINADLLSQASKLLKVKKTSMPEGLCYPRVSELL